jgi:hypothetical protein
MRSEEKNSCSTLQARTNVRGRGETSTRSQMVRRYGTEGLPTGRAGRCGATRFSASGVPET